MFELRVGVLSCSLFYIKLRLFSEQQLFLHFNTYLPYFFGHHSIILS